MLTKLNVEIEKIIGNVAEEIIGDTPVSVQLAMALDKMATKEDVDALRSDLNALRKELEKLIDLVGDISVAEQINMMMSKSENR